MALIATLNLRASTSLGLSSICLVNPAHSKALCQKTGLGLVQSSGHVDGPRLTWKRKRSGLRQQLLWAGRLLYEVSLKSCAAFTSSLATQAAGQIVSASLEVHDRQPAPASPRPDCVRWPRNIVKTARKTARSSGSPSWATAARSAPNRSLAGRWRSS